MEWDLGISPPSNNAFKPAFQFDMPLSGLCAKNRVYVPITGVNAPRIGLCAKNGVYVASILRIER